MQKIKKITFEMDHCSCLRKWSVGFPRSWSLCVLHQRVVTGKGIKGCTEGNRRVTWDSVAKECDGQKAPEMKE